MALGEIAVQVVPDLSKFLSKLNADLRKATDRISASSSKAAESVENEFRQASSVVDEQFDKMKREADDSMDMIGKSAAASGEKVERSFREAAISSESHLGRIGGGLKGVGTKLVAGLAAFGIGHFLKEATLEAEEANKALATTAQLIESTGGKANVSLKQIENLSKDLLFRIGVDDTEVVKASNVLLTFTNVTGDIFDETIMRAADMSAVFGTDLAGASMQLGKALNDPIKGLTALSRAGVSFTAEQKEQIKAMVKAGDTAGAQRLILDELARQFGGTAEASASASKRIGAYFGELKESLGSAIVPAIEGIAPSLISLLEALQGPMAEIGKMFATFLQPLIDVISVVLPPLIDILGSVFEVIGATLSALAPVIEPIVTIIAQLADIFAGVFVDVLEMAAPLIELFATALADIASNVLPIFASLLEDLSPILGMIFEQIGGLAESVLPIFIGLFEDAAPIVGEIVKVIGRLAEKVLPVLVRIIEKLAPVFADVLLDVLEALVPVFETIGDAVIQLLPSLEILGETFATVIGSLAPILPQIANAIIMVVQAFAPLLPQLIQIVNTLLPPLAELLVAITPLIVDGLNLALQVLTPLLEGVVTVLGFIVEKFAAVVEWVAKTLGQFETLGELVSGIWEGIKEAFRAAVQFIGEKFDEIVEFITGLPGRVLELVESLAEAGTALGKGFIDAFVAALKAVGGFAADIGKAIANALIDAINWASQKVNDFIPNSIGYGPVSINLPDNPIPPIPRLANGAIVDSPTFAMIGEAGPEMVLPLSRPSRARSLLATSGIIDSDSVDGRSGPLVQIQTANFSNGVDVDVMAQQLYASIRTQGVAA